MLAAGMHSCDDDLSQDGSIASTGDSDVVRQMRREMGASPWDVVIFGFYDPFQPFSENTKYYSSPLVAIIQNLPQHLRWEHSAAHLVCLQSGSRNKKEAPTKECMMEIFSDELQWLSTEGVDVWDAHTLSTKRYTILF